MPIYLLEMVTRLDDSPAAESALVQATWLATAKTVGVLCAEYAKQVFAVELYSRDTTELCRQGTTYTAPQVAVSQIMSDLHEVTLGKAHRYLTCC